HEMRMAYLFDRPLPAKETDSEQVMKTVAALSRRGVDVTLVLPRKPAARGSVRNGVRSSAQDRTEELKDYYQVQGSFAVHELPNAASRASTPRKWLHARNALRYARELNVDLVYTRNFPTLFCAPGQPLPFAYETYRPWADQFSPLKMPF